ncbi:hypothetical protein V6N11_083771 [Hibiscus sabdariffa]|uniref:Uncharacterized protein n=1 Tax=Hibiscus sabdariffa TaxID=183260 RepID=A0ABR2QCH6_9ROSI
MRLRVIWGTIRPSYLQLLVGQNGEEDVMRSLLMFVRFLVVLWVITVKLGRNWLRRDTPITSGSVGHEASIWCRLTMGLVKMAYGRYSRAACLVWSVGDGFQDDIWILDLGPLLPTVPINDLCRVADFAFIDEWCGAGLVYICCLMIIPRLLHPFRALFLLTPQSMLIGSLIPTGNFLLRVIADWKFLNNCYTVIWKLPGAS